MPPQPDLPYRRPPNACCDNPTMSSGWSDGELCSSNLVSLWFPARGKALNDQARCLDLACAVTRRRFPVGASPTRQPLQPEAIGAVTEVTKWLKPSISVSRIGDSASVQAATRVNAEQASKRTMCRPTRLPYRGRLKWLGALSEDYAHLLHRGIGGRMYTRKAYATREAPRPAMTNRKPVRDRLGAMGWRRGS